MIAEPDYLPVVPKHRLVVEIDRRAVAPWYTVMVETPDGPKVGWWLTQREFDAWFELAPTEETVHTS